MKVARIAVAFALAISTGAALAQLYRWTDEQGRVHVTDTPPPPSAKGVKKSGAAPAPAAKGDQGAGNEPYALQVARKSNPVTLYTTPGCEACTEARKLLNARGIPFKEISVNDEKQLEELRKAVGSNSVPSMIVGANVQKGFEEGNYNRALDAAGYPKAGTLPPRSQAEPQPQAPGAQNGQPESKPAAPEAPLGPYAPGAPPQRAQKK